MRSIASAAAVLVLSGCLGNTYRIDAAELARLAAAPPVGRGNEVRVVQLNNGDEPGRPVQTLAPKRPAVEATRVALTGAQVAVDTARIHQAVTSGGSSRDDGPDIDLDLDDAGDSGAAAAVILIVAAAVVALATAGLVVLASVDASRFDGWARLDPDAPLYLLGADGQWYLVPLSELRPEHAAMATEARVLDDSIAEELGRAPLDRPGFAYGMDFGGSGVTRQGAPPDPMWPSVRVRIGAFPIQELGLYGSLAFTFASDSGVLLNARYAFEAQAFPFAFEPVHFGLYGQVGDNHRLWERAGVGIEQTHSLLWGGGLLLELDVTTHLGVSLRGGLNAVHEGSDIHLLGEVALGATVY